MTVDVSRFAAVLGDVIKADMKKILTAIFVVDDPIVRGLTVVKALQAGNIYFRKVANVSEVAQPLVRSIFTHKGDIVISPSSWKQFGHKVNNTMVPEDLIGTFPGIDLFDETKGASAQAFTRWALENQILDQLNEDHITKQLYYGVFVDHSADVSDGPFPAIDSLNGLQYALANGDFFGEHFANVLTIGALSDTPLLLYNQIQDAVKEIPERYRFSVAMTCYLPETKRQLYWEGREQTIGQRVHTDDTNRNVIPNTRISLVGSPGMIGSDDLFITKPKNVVQLIDISGVAKNMRLLEQEYGVNVVANYSLAYGYDYLEEVWTNVPLGGWPSSPSASVSAS